MTISRFRRLLVLVTLLMVLSSFAGAALASPVHQEGEQPIVRGACEPPRSDEGVFITFNTNITLDSELLQGLFNQATTYVRRGTVSAGQGNHAQARRFYSYAIDYLEYLYN